MNWRINESGVSATIENIEWERIHLILTVRLHIDGQKTYDIDKMEFYAVNNLGGCGVKFREFDTLKSKKVPQSLEIGLFFCQIFIFII